MEIDLSKLESRQSHDLLTSSIIPRPIAWVSSKKIKPQRIQEAKISFECSLERIVRINEGPDAGNLILGHVKLVHIDEHILTKDIEVDFKLLDALGRLSGKYYCTTQSIIESEKN